MADKVLVWLHGEVRTPPFSTDARIEAGFRLRQLQQGERLSLPHSRPLPVVGARCHELRVTDEDQTWRILYRTDENAILVLDVFSKKTPATPPSAIVNCKRRLTAYDNVAEG